MIKIALSDKCAQYDFQLSENGDITIFLSPTDDLGRVMSSIESNLLKAIADFLEDLWSNSNFPREFETTESFVVISRGH